MSLIQFSDVSFTYDGSYDPVFEHLNLQLDTNWKLGLIGRNGRGKTTMLRLLMGQLEPSGRISCPVPCAYFPYPVRDPSRDALSIVEEVTQDFQLWQLERELGRLAVDPSVLDRPFDTLSNGERTKLLLAALFLNEEQYLLIDEPTNHLDLPARHLVGDYLRGKKGFLLVSHDRAFLDRSIDHVLSLGRSSVELQNGNYSSWQLNRDRQDREWKTPLGFMGDVKLRKWRFELSDHLYWGEKQFSDYQRHGNQLFRGDPYYRSKLYNRTDLTFYLLNKSYVQCRVTASVHYTEQKIDNSQQIILHLFPDKDLLGKLFKR